MNFTLILDKKWGQKSVLIYPDSDFYKLKKHFIHLLLTSNIIENLDITNRNDTPHIELVKTKNEIKFQMDFLYLNNKQFSIELKEFSIDDNCVMYNFSPYKHMTLFYKKDLFKNIDRNFVLQLILTSIQKCL